MTRGEIARNRPGEKFEGEFMGGKSPFLMCDVRLAELQRDVYFSGEFANASERRIEIDAGYKHGIASCTLADGLQYTAKYHLGKRISRKRVSNLPWGYAQDDDDPLANITPVAGSVSSQDKKIAKGHKASVRQEGGGGGGGGGGK